MLGGAKPRAISTDRSPVRRPPASPDFLAALILILRTAFFLGLGQPMNAAVLIEIEDIGLSVHNFGEIARARHCEAGMHAVEIVIREVQSGRQERSPICHNLPMCGRYRLSRRKQIIEEHFDGVSGEEDWTPRYNIAPTQHIPVIRQHPKKPNRMLSLMRWGLIPSWAKDMSGAAGMINARSETAATKPAFRDPMKFRRCLVPADGFYEWVRTGKAKQPYCFEVNEGELFAFAGLWDRWKDPSGQWIKSCSILTTTPNAVTSAVHGRMPVILDPGNYDVWLDPGMNNVEAASEMLKPYDAGLMRCYPVSTRINHAANDDAECARPVELGEVQNRLFP
jgi:putative SOS response-associated peptidase YedK